MRRVGIDVGGTNTDAVLLDGDRVAHAAKVTTTDDVTSGMRDALAALADKETLSNLDAIVVGTTHFINAVVQRSELEPVAALRIGTPASRSIPPYCDWPDGLRRTIDHGIWSVAGGHEYDGSPFLALDEEAVRDAALHMGDQGLRSVAICGVFSPVNAEHEERAAAIIRDVCRDMYVTCSSNLGRIGLLERENVALLNAALVDLARRVTDAIVAAAREVGVTAPLYFSRNDGTVASIEDTVRQPVYSFACGATNSMRGGAFLSGMKEAVIADVGGTTTDVGLLQGGFPRQANSTVEIGGVRTLFRMPEVLSIGLGGGSLVSGDGSAVGPRSVGYRLSDEALVFGGSTLTATDVAVASGLAQIGHDSEPPSVPVNVRQAFDATCRRMLEEVVDRVKIKAGDLPVVAVGGAAFLVPNALGGAAKVVRVPHAECANAVGAALAQVAGEVDHIYKDASRDEALEDAQKRASERAINAGANADTLELTDVEEIPLAYLPGNSVRVRARVIGTMKTAGSASQSASAQVASVAS